MHEGIPEEMKVLLVDDAPICRKMLAKLLAERGIKSEEAEDGEKSVEIVKASVRGEGKGFDMILMDFSMPEMNGAEATQHIRRIGYKGPIYGVTGNVLPEDLKEFVASGLTKVFKKPLKPEDLDEILPSRMLPLLL